MPYISKRLHTHPCLKHEQQGQEGLIDEGTHLDLGNLLSPLNQPLTREKPRGMLQMPGDKDGWREKP